MMLLSRPCFVDSPPPRLPSCAFSSSQSLSLSLSLWRRPPRHHLRLTNTNTTITNINMISCSSSSSSNNHIISRNNKQQTGHPPPPAPQLLLSSLSNPEYRYLYDLTFCKKGKGGKEEEEQVVGIKLNRELHLPDISKRIFIGSSQGFLISIDMFRLPTIHAFNPITGSHLHIPHPPPPIPPPRRPNHFCALADYGTGSLSFASLYNSKAILSPSLDFIVLFPIYSPDPLFAPLSSSSSSSLSSSSDSSTLWSKLPDLHGCTEGIFHKGLLHAIDDVGTLEIYDLKNDMFPDVPDFSIANKPRYLGKDLYIRSSLVESPNGEDLFLVFREMDENVHIHDPYRLQTNSCEVYKLTYNEESEENEWVLQVEDGIRDRAFFVGSKSTCLSLDVSDRKSYPCLKPNSVYFTDSFDSSHLLELVPHSIGNIAGVCSLENRGDNKVQYMDLVSEDNRKLDWPPPVWYMPHPASSAVIDAHS